MNSYLVYLRLRKCKLKITSLYDWKKINSMHYFREFRRKAFLTPVYKEIECKICMCALHVSGNQPTELLMSCFQGIVVMDLGEYRSI